MVKANKLPNTERVKSPQRVSEIYHKGVAGFVYPFKYHFITQPSEKPDQSLLKICIAVSKKKFKHAVDRNRVKRLVKEAYRLNKMAFYDKPDNKNKQVELYLVFVGKVLPEYGVIEKGIKSIIQKID
ncbi:MAG: ribonuclease P protein component [Saprospiraceae bacterium]|nr:ribonuclease P protein component [Saprospiraceae bacterium]